MGRGSAPPPILGPVPLVAALAFPCLAWFPGLLVAEGYELHKLVRAATFTRQPYNAPVQIDR